MWSRGGHIMANGVILGLKPTADSKIVYDAATSLKFLDGPFVMYMGTERPTSGTIDLSIIQEWFTRVFDEEFYTLWSSESGVYAQFGWIGNPESYINFEYNGNSSVTVLWNPPNIGYKGLTFMFRHLQLGAP